MLITFSLDNWKSFRDRAELRMTAVSAVRPRERLFFVPEYRMRLLPVAALHGRNASGKTAFVEALGFLRDLVLRGTPNPDGKIPVRPFKLESECLRRPTRLELKTLIDGRIWSYRVSLTPERILDERLTLAYERREGETMRFDEAFFRSKNELEQLRLIERSTRENQLFLTTAVQCNAVRLRPLYDWFARLSVLTPRCGSVPVEASGDPKHPLGEAVTQMMRDSGIGLVRLEAVRVEGPADRMGLLGERLALLGSDAFLAEDMLVRREGGGVVLERLRPILKNARGEETALSWSDLSDGTRRLLALVPVFAQLKEGVDGVFVIDDLELGLHPNVSAWLVKSVLGAEGPAGRAQLVFTTHDANLLDAELIRPDEAWSVGKSAAGASTLRSAADFGSC